MEPSMSCAIVLVLEFLSVVCIIDEDDFDLVWEMVVQSLAQMPYDQKSNANKKRARELGHNLSSASHDSTSPITASSASSNGALPATCARDRSASEDANS